ncbi:PFGI-1 class ICE element type IV pilus protein PilL2 [Xanthomonas euvesicatoria]|uniref:PFGI-1 class ICE element type IV pilus protein PilL2 n=1 Tax=Xanthomonas euvesicatoria TaxID=456327 RepID=UPI001C48CD3C|nr:integrating conjugative element protein pill, pfgi-1 [Xanthomonas euvesicatoria]MBV6791558.1 integrating conjugative element protein pill, pfgi-1 [Xanthomonas campestris pv. clerodendri]
MCPSHPWFHHPERRLLSGFLGLLWTMLAGGCATTATPLPPPPEAPVAVAPEPAPEFVPVVRYGRYTLVELAPTASQQDLMLQVVDVAVADTLHASVGDALRYVLLRSGYRLCDGTESDALQTLPLPVAHYRLGPLLLRDALLTLTGPAWDLHVDDSARQVCFTRAATATPSAPDAPATDATVQTFPLGEVRP